jgi:hypothetical protein
LYIHRYTHPLGELPVVILSDMHLGSPEVDDAKIKADLARSGRKLIIGDTFDAIIASDQKRYRPSAVHSRFQGRTDMLNAVEDYAYELLAPYADEIDVLGTGNHETSIEKHCSYDIALRLADRLGVPYGGYCGFVEYKFTDDQRHTTRYPIFYHHGAGGGGSLSSAASEFTKKMQFVDARLIVTGHRHFRMATHMRRISCPKAGVDPKYDEVFYVMSGSYLDTYTPQRERPRKGNYAEDRGLPPQGKGGVVVRLLADTVGVKTEIVL